MPSCSKALEEMMCFVLGDLIQEGCVAKVADDLYVGGQATKGLITIGHLFYSHYMHIKIV